MLTGSKLLVVVPLCMNTNVPPGWIALSGTVEEVATTLPIPPVTARDTAAEVAGVFLLVVAVALAFDPVAGNADVTAVAKAAVVVVSGDTSCASDAVDVVVV